MSRTDNTVPARLRAQYGIPDHRGYCWGGHHSYLNGYAQLRNRQARHLARATLHRGDEPEPYRSRHSARWDAW